MTQFFGDVGPQNFQGNITMEDVKKYGAAGTLSYVITVHGFGIFQDGLSLPRPNFQTFWEPLGKTILKETRKV